MNGPRMRLAARALVALGVVAVALGALPRPGAAAHGVVSMSWDQCSNPVLGSNLVPAPGVFGCPAVPARPSTWGQVKNAYRR